MGQAKKATWTPGDWQWAGWSWGNRQAHQGYYHPGDGSGFAPCQHQSAAATQDPLAEPNQQQLCQDQRCRNPVQRASADSVSIGQGHQPGPLIGLVRPVGQSPHWSIPAPLLPHTPTTPRQAVRVAAADDRLGGRLLRRSVSLRHQ